MRSPHVKYSRSISAPNTCKAVKFGPGWVEIEANVKITDQAEPVKILVVCTSPRGHGTRGAGVRFMFRIDEERFALESGNFFDEDGRPVNLPRMGLVITDVPSSSAWVKRFEEPAK